MPRVLRATARVACALALSLLFAGAGCGRDDEAAQTTARTVAAETETGPTSTAAATLDLTQKLARKEFADSFAVDEAGNLYVAGDLADVRDARFVEVTLPG